MDNMAHCEISKKYKGIKVRHLVRLIWAARNVKVLSKGGNCRGISGFTNFLILFQCHTKDFAPAMIMECRYLADVNIQLSPVSVMSEIGWRNEGPSCKVRSKGSFDLYNK